MANLNETFKTILRPYSRIAIILDSVLRWEAPYYPLITVGFVSVFYTMLYYTNMSIVSYFCLMGIITTFVDFSLPIVNDILTKDWSTSDETQYKQVCSRYSSAFSNLFTFFKRFGELRNNNIKLYYVILLSLLLTFAWIGTWVSDIFFLYVVSLFIVLYPGLSQQEAFQKHVTTRFHNVTSCLLPQIKSERKER